MIMYSIGYLTEMHCEKILNYKMNEKIPFLYFCDFLTQWKLNCILFSGIVQPSTYISTNTEVPTSGGTVADLNVQPPFRLCNLMILWR